MIDEKYVGNGKVVLIAGGGKIYTDIAARFVSSERDLEDIVASPYSKTIVQNILNSGHRAALEFDYFLFGVEGYSRVTETQLVRKRMASYLIKSGRVEQGGKRKFSVVIPESIRDLKISWYINGQTIDFDTKFILELLERWYRTGLKEGIPEEDLRYLKPQATEFKGIIGMNAHALLDWFGWRMCRNAQAEIRDMATKMCKLCKQAAPDLFENAGPNCVQLGYCPENDRQNESCKRKIMTKEQAMKILKNPEFYRDKQ